MNTKFIKDVDRLTRAVLGEGPGGIFPKRMSLHGDRVGYLWSDLLAWRDAKRIDGLFDQS